MLHSHTMKMGGVFKRTAAAPLNRVDVTVPVQAFRPPIEGTGVLRENGQKGQAVDISGTAPLGNKGGCAGNMRQPGAFAHSIAGDGQLYARPPWYYAV